MEYFLNPAEADDEEKNVNPEHVRLMAKNVPPQIVRLNSTVSGLVLDTLQSDKGTQFFEHLKEARDAMMENPGHSEINVVFRADYMTAWCRELWRFRLTRECGIQVMKSELPFRPVCPHCMPSYGYQGPHRVEDKWVDTGSEYRGQTVAEESKLRDRMLVADIMQMRAAGDFDEAVRFTAATLRDLQISMMGYKVLYVTVHRLTDGRIAMCPGFSINLMMAGLHEDYSFAIRRARSYYAPCDQCKGEGCLSKPI